jgi:glycosyltransferase involved in cell wall biosynthesis
MARGLGEPLAVVNLNAKDMEREDESLSVYVVTRFASQANRRNIQLLSLKDVLPKVVLVHQAKGNTYQANGSLTIAQFPRLTGVLGRVGLSKLEQSLEEHLYFPSAAILYVKPAIRKLQREIEKELAKGRRVCVITLLPPHDLVLIGLELKRRFPSVFWIIDWQDLWSYDENYFSHLPDFNKDRVRRLEQSAFDRCDMNVVTNGWARAVLEERYGVRPDRVTVISHASDAQPVRHCCERPIAIPAQDGVPIKLGFLGNLFKPPKVSGDKIVAALDRVRQSNIDVVLHVFGDKYLNSVSGAAETNREWLIVHKSTSHEQSLEEIADCDFLLIALSDLPNCRAIMPLKLPFYFELRKPILAIVPDPSAVADIVRTTGTGYVIPTNHEDWEINLTQVLRAYKHGGASLKRNEEEIARYSWENISKQWLSVISNEPNLANAQT